MRSRSAPVSDATFASRAVTAAEDAVTPQMRVWPWPKEPRLPGAGPDVVVGVEVPLPPKTILNIALTIPYEKKTRMSPVPAFLMISMDFLYRSSLPPAVIHIKPPITNMRSATAPRIPITALITRPMSNEMSSVGSGFSRSYEDGAVCAVPACAAACCSSVPQIGRKSVAQREPGIFIAQEFGSVWLLQVESQIASSEHGTLAFGVSVRAGRVQE